MPEGVPVDQIPFKDDIGKVVKVSLQLLPLILGLRVSLPLTPFCVLLDPRPAYHLCELPEGA